MANIFEALKSIVSTGMPEGQSGPNTINQGINKIVLGGVVEEPNHHQPSQAERLIRTGVQEELSDRTTKISSNSLFGGAVESDDSEARAAAAYRRKEIMNTALGVVGQGLKGAFGLAGRGLKAGVEAGARAAANRKKKPTPSSSRRSPTYAPQLPEPQHIIEGEFIDIDQPVNQE